MRSGWPPWGGWPPEALRRAAGAMFVGYASPSRTCTEDDPRLPISGHNKRISLLQNMFAQDMLYLVHSWISAKHLTLLTMMLLYVDFLSIIYLLMYCIGLEVTCLEGIRLLK